MDPKPTWLRIVIWMCMSLVLLLIGCDNNGGSAVPPAPATVAGRVLDASSLPVSDALVTVLSDPQQTTTDEEGRFSISVEAGNHQVTISKDGMTLNVICFTAAEGVTHDLGDITPTTTSNCQIPLPSAGDRDGDGLADVDEETGWNVTVVNGDGTTSTRLVTSDPDYYDTDGDGLNDYQERAALTDPRRADTDNDLLSDYAELKVYKSNPSRVDSDGDACDPDADIEGCLSDPNLWDGYELALSKTSPTLDDTDGDGLDDYREIKTGGTNPLRADLPELRLKLHGDPSIILNMTDLINDAKHAVQSTLEQDTEKQVDTDTTSTKMSIENTVSIHTETEAGTSAWPPSFNAKITTDTVFKHGYFHETSSSWSKESVNASQREYEATLENIAQVSYDDGMVWVAMKIANISGLSFKLKDLKVIAYRMKPNGSFSTVGTLTPGYKDTKVISENPLVTVGIWVEDPLCVDPATPATCGIVLGPSDEVTLVVGADSLPAQEMRALVANPTAMMFEVGSYSLFQLDEFGVTETVNYAKLGESVLERTGVIIVDHGNGTVDRHMVATNVYRNPDGSARGISMQEALAGIIGLDYEAQREVIDEDNEGNLVLYRIGDTEAYVDELDSAKRGLWIVASNNPNFDPEADIDFENIHLGNGEQVSLVYVEDSDGDGIFNREENLLGTDILNPDTDGDSLTDYEETKEGWEVAVNGLEPYWVNPDPRFADVDGDQLSDATEKYLGTDPYLRDTDSDGLLDTDDPNPLLPPCLDGNGVGTTAWWDGSYYVANVTNYFAEDIWTSEVEDEITANDGLMTDESIVQNSPDDPLGYFKFNPSEPYTQYIDVDDHASVSPAREYTVAAWLLPFDSPAGKGSSTVYTKGPSNQATYELTIGYDDTPSVISITASLYRSTHEKCWWWGVDSSCADENYNQKVSLTWTADPPLEVNEWYHVVVTFSGEMLRMYIDGELKAEKSTTATWYSGISDEWKYKTYTNYLIDNDYPLRIGGDMVLDYPYRGRADDIQTFIRGINASEVLLLHNLGMCEPKGPP